MARLTFVFLYLTPLTFFLATFGFTFSAAADEPTVQQPGSAESKTSPILVLPETMVTATLSDTEIGDIGRSVAVRDKEEIDDFKYQNLTSAIQSVPGVRSADVGGPGSPGTTPIEIRGFGSRGTQILYNGMTLSDPSSISGGFEQFFGYLTLEDVSRIEVLRGGTGVLYGSDGQGGAINLIPILPEPGIKTVAGFEGGSFETYQEFGQMSVGTDRGGLVGTVSRIDSSGIDTHGNYGNTTVAGVGSYEVIPNKLRMTPVFRLIDVQNNDLDNSPAPVPGGGFLPATDSEKNNVDARAYLIGNTFDATVSDNLTTEARVYYVDTDRDFYFDFDGFEATSSFKGSSLNADLLNRYALDQYKSDGVFGFEFEHQEVETDSGDVQDDEQRDQWALFLHNQTAFFDDLLNWSGGARVTGISNISKVISTLETAVSVKIPWTNSRVHSSLAQGFRAPTLFETDGDTIDFATGELVSVGNSDLDEEKSITFDVGLEQSILNGMLIADVTFFNTDADQPIIFDFENQTHLNGDSSQNQGLEYSLLLRPTEYFYLRGAYTHLSKAEGLDGDRRQRAPRNWFSLSTAVEIAPVTVAAEVEYRDSQFLEFFGEAERAKEDGATILNATASYTLSEQIELYVRGINIFDSQYTEAGFYQPRASVYGGFRVQWARG